MRLNRSVAALSIAMLAGACGKTEEPVVTKATTHASALAPAPQTYQRMRFVSPVEQSGSGTSRALVSAVRHEAHHAVATARAQEPAVAAPDPLASLASSTPVAQVTSSNAASEPGIVVALKSAPEPVGTPAVWASEPVFEPQSRAVIRGGAVGPDKCDPLSDMRARRANGGTMRAPVQGASVFSRGGRN